MVSISLLEAYMRPQGHHSWTALCRSRQSKCPHTECGKSLDAREVETQVTVWYLSVSDPIFILPLGVSLAPEASGQDCQQLCTNYMLIQRTAWLSSSNAKQVLDNHQTAGSSLMVDLVHVMMVRMLFVDYMISWSWSHQVIWSSDSVCLFYVSYFVS